MESVELEKIGFRRAFSGFLEDRNSVLGDLQKGKGERGKSERSRSKKISLLPAPLLFFSNICFAPVFFF